MIGSEGFRHCQPRDAEASGKRAYSNPTKGWLQAAQNGNVTDTISRSMLVSLVNAKGQGLGDDAPTQNQIINTALQQLKSNKKIVYTSADITTVGATPASLKKYGNDLAILIAKHAENHNDYAQTLLAIDDATATKSDDSFKDFPGICHYLENDHAEYK